MKRLIVTAKLLSVTLSSWAGIINGPSVTTIRVEAAVHNPGGGFDTVLRSDNNHNPMNISASNSNGNESASLTGSFSYSYSDSFFTQDVVFSGSATGSAIYSGNSGSTWNFSLTTPTTFSISGTMAPFADTGVGLTLAEQSSNTVFFSYDSQTQGPAISGLVLLPAGNYYFQTGAHLFAQGVTGSASYSFVATVPEPSTTLLGMLAFAGCCFHRRGAIMRRQVRFAQSY